VLRVNFRLDRCRRDGMEVPQIFSDSTDSMMLTVSISPFFISSFCNPAGNKIKQTRRSAVAEWPRNASCQLKSCQLPRNSAETTCTTSPEQIEVMKLKRYSKTMCNKHVHSTTTRQSCSHCLVRVINKPTTVELCISPVYRRLAVAKFSKSRM